MRKYVCSVCGYVFDEEMGVQEAGIEPGTKWEDIPDSFVCPLCGAPKSAFGLQEKKAETKVVTPKKSIQKEENSTKLSNAELSIVFSNLAKGCGKQYKYEENKMFLELADYFKDNSTSKKGSLIDLMNLIDQNIKTDYSQGIEVAKEEKDRGALRALIWGEKVTIILQSLLERYKRDGSKFLETTKIFVCQICGFIYVGNETPNICPICKVPKEKIHEVL